MTDTTVGGAGRNWAAYEAVLNQTDSRGSARAVLLVIALHWNNSQHKAFPGIKTIADHCGLSHDTVQRAIQKLEADGEVKVSRRGFKQVNVYIIPYLAPATTQIAPLTTEYICKMRSKAKDTNVSLDASKEDSICSSTRSLRVEQTRDWDVALVLLSQRFAQQLVAAGKKQAVYQSDALSDEWLYGVEKVIFGARVVRGQQMEWWQRVFDEGAPERWPYITTPLRLYGNLQDVEAALADEDHPDEADRPASGGPNATPEKESSAAYARAVASHDAAQVVDTQADGAVPASIETVMVSRVHPRQRGN